MAQQPFSSDGGFSTTGNITTANISANYVIFSGGLISSGASPAPSISGVSSISAVGNITAGNIGITGGSLTWANASIVQTSASDVSITGDGQVTVRSLDGTYQWTFDSNGNLAAPGNVSAVGNIAGGNLITSGSGGAITMTGGNITGAGNISATGNIIANNIGNIAALNLNGNANTVLYGNGTFAAAAASSSYGNANVATFMAAYGSNTISTSGNITAGNIIGNINPTSNINGTTANVTLVAGAYNWNFDNTGNLTLPANTFSVNYANGTTVALGGNYGNANVVANLAALSSNPISTTGNVTASNFIGNGVGLTNVTVSVAGNIVGTSSNVSLVAGSYTMTFDNTGLLTLPTMGGDEGGEINLGIPATNTTLQNRVAIDVFQDRIRFFEGSANAKGAYIDLAQSSAGVGTLLNNRVSGLVNAGTFVTMDLIKATVTTTGNRGLSLATTTGTLAYSIGGTYGMATPASGGSAGTGTLTTTPTASIFNWGFVSTGDMSTYILTDTTNSRAYRITLQIGASFNNNMISIERLI
jgi:hypothetical protein